MKVSFNWLNNRFFGGDLPSPEIVAERLTLGAFEIESVEKIILADGQSDTILDAKILPNRSHDCLSHKGIAREIAILLDKKISYEPESAQTFGKIKTADLVSVTIEAEALCHRAMKKVATGVKVGPSPKWLADYLTAVGVKPINNVVDAANFVMLETGQPVHTFDLDKISGGDNDNRSHGGKKEIFIRRAKPQETLTALDGKKYELDPSIVVIADEKRALDIAGIKGGAESGIDEHTKNVLMSACNFDPISIRLTSKKLGLRTDASHRFENGITPELIPDAIALLSALIEQTAGGEVSGDEVDIYPRPEKLHVIEVTPEQIEAVLGLTLSEKEIGALLDAAGFSYKLSGNTFVVSAPPERLDVRITEDVIEEMALRKGLDAIPLTPISPLSGRKVLPHKTPVFTDMVRKILTDQGFSEVYTYAFANHGHVEVANPLASNKKALRQSLVPAFSVALEQNASRTDLLGLNTVCIFEIGTIFHNTDQGGETLSLVLGARIPGANPKTKIPEEYVSSAVEALSGSLGVEIKKKNTTEGGSVVVEIDLTHLLATLPEPDIKTYTHDIKLSSNRYKKISPYPFIVRDIAVFVPTGTGSDSVLEKILPHIGPLLVHERLFDTFEKKMPDGTTKTSYAFRFVFQSPERTLNDEEVNVFIEKATEILNSVSGWQVR